MVKKLYLPLLMALVVTLSPCSNKMDALSSDYFTTTPQVLEAVGGEVPVTTNGKFPEKYFKKNAVVEVAPVPKQEGGQVKGQPTAFQGEKVEGDDQTISYKMGGNYMMKTTFDYALEMAESELYLEFNAKIEKKVIVIPVVKITDGAISTSELINNILSSASLVLGDDVFQRIIKEAHNVNVTFLIQQANIRSSELKTAKEFNKEVANVNDTENRKISNIEILVYVSPDGGVRLNIGLAENREGNTTKLINKDLKKTKIEVLVDVKYITQDWEGFQELVSKSNIQDKELILRVLSMYQDPEQRETEIKNISSVYKILVDEILPQLRRSCLTLNYETIGKSDEEIANLAATGPKQLSLEEILYVAILTNDPIKKADIYAKASQRFLNDYRAFDNLGKLAYQAGDLDKVQSYVKKAESIKAAPEVNMNLGLITLAKGDKAVAESYLGKAAGTKELNETLGNLYVAQGQYKRAANVFGDTKTNSAALAQILVKDYNKVKNTLAGVSTSDAYTDYLMVVLGVRISNTPMLTSNLKSVVVKNPTLAKKVVTSFEFTKHYTNSDFMNIVK